MEQKSYIFSFRRLVFSLGLLLCVQIFISCSSSLPFPRNEDLNMRHSETVSLDDLLSGRELYVKKCSGCHSLYLPKEYSPAGWDTILTAMNQRAKITEEESSSIRVYLSMYSNNKQKE